MKKKSNSAVLFSTNLKNMLLGGGVAVADGLFAHNLLKKKHNKKTGKKPKRNSLSKKFVNGFLNLLIVLSFSGFAFWQGPKLVYTLFPQLGAEKLVQANEVSGDFTLNLNLLDEEATKRKVLPSKRSYMPPYNANLPEGDWLVIPRIGVRSQLQQTENFEEALETGLWWVPDFGKPGDRSKPMIIAGHRYGFDWWWKDDYWKYHSFYNLPDLEPGDRIEIISNQRKWVYEIYGGEEGKEITDYQSDLILYTCKHIDSPVRIFRYAKLVEVEGETSLGVLNN
jgi:sortase (surface protein transpeptidase)